MPVLWFGVLPDAPLNLVYHDAELSDATLDDMFDQAHDLSRAARSGKAEAPVASSPVVAASVGTRDG